MGSSLINPRMLLFQQQLVTELDNMKGSRKKKKIIKKSPKARHSHNVREEDKPWEYGTRKWIGVSQEGVKGTRRVKRLALRAGAMLRLVLAWGIGRAYREEGVPAFSGQEAHHPTSLRALCLTLSPFCLRTQAHQGPGRCCPRVSWRLGRFRHLGPPSPGSLPQAFAEPETCKPWLVSASSRGVRVTERRPTAAASAVTLLSPSSWCPGEGRVVAPRFAS